jgi:multidrug transporter EmrE-like cation transporter
MWILLMVVILLTNGMSAFGLKVLAGWGLPASVHYPYLSIWYAAGLACIAIPLAFRKQKFARAEIGWGAVLAALSIGGQVAMADALQSGIPGNIVFPITIGGSILVVALASRVFFSEKMHPLSRAGVVIGFVAVILLGMS